ncbi:hypothetical protein [Leptospira interrogans]|nr:hypothetical protein [Leptospira interrogans]
MNWDILVLSLKENWKIRPTPEDDSKGKSALICAYYKIEEGHTCGLSDEN